MQEESTSVFRAEVCRLRKCLSYGHLQEERVAVAEIYVTFQVNVQMELLVQVLIASR